jgi:Ca2+-binding RTX toxin-like protein
VANPRPPPTTYAGRTNPVFVILDDVANDGEIGEGDNVHADVENVIGGDGDDKIEGSAANNVLRGGNGNDTLSGNAGNDTLDGGAGSDEMFGNAGARDMADYTNTFSPMIITLDDNPNDGPFGQNDNVHSDVEDLRGGQSNDLLIGSDVPNRIFGSAGNDTLQGKGGDDFLQGDAGADRHEGGSGTDTASYEGRFFGVTVDIDGIADDGELGEGDNILLDVENLTGGNASDKLTGSLLANFLSGGVGNDTLDGAGGNDTLLGFTGSDIYIGGPGVDTVTYVNPAFAPSTTPLSVNIDGLPNDGAPGEGDNVNTDVENLIGNAGNDTFLGSAANNTFVGNGGNDTLVGLGGNDTLDGGTGADDLSGGAGEDTATYAPRTNAVTVTLDGVANDGETAEGDNARADIENILGGGGNDQLTGNAANNTLQGGPGNDTLTGLAGTDQLGGEDGDDVLDGGADADQFRGGDGVDTADYSNANGPVTVTLDDLADDGEAGEADNVASDVENVRGSKFDDSITGSSADNLLEGGEGNDLLDGQDGNDTLDGGPGSDTMLGGNGDDKALGDDPDDKVDLGAGDDGLVFFGTNKSDHITVGRQVINGIPQVVFTIKNTTLAFDYRNGETVTVFGLDGNDHIEFLPSAGERWRALFVGGPGNDHLSGAQLNDTLLGNEGNDKLEGNGGTDTLLD